MYERVDDVVIHVLESISWKLEQYVRQDNMMWFEACFSVQHSHVALAVSPICSRIRGSDRCQFSAVPLSICRWSSGSQSFFESDHI